MLHLWKNTKRHHRSRPVLAKYVSYLWQCESILQANQKGAFRAREGTDCSDDIPKGPHACMHESCTILLPGPCAKCLGDMPRSERKRQYSALRRAILKEANPALTAKFTLCGDNDRTGQPIHACSCVPAVPIDVLALADDLPGGAC